MDIHKDQLQVIDTLRRLNRLFVQVRDIKKLLSELCGTLMTVNNFQAVWIAVLNSNKEVLNFEHQGHGVYASELETQLLTKGISKCVELAIQKGEPYFVEEDEETCINCPLLHFKEDAKPLVVPVYFQKDLLGIITLAVIPGHQLSELERTMLIELSEDLGNAINTIQLEQGKEILSDTMNRLTKSILGNSSKEVLNSFMKNLLISLDADYAFIGRLIPGFEDRIRTITISSSNGEVDNFEYTLMGTPCGEVIKKDICCYSAGVADLFPEDIMLQDMGIEAYIGAPLVDSNDEVSGIMVVLKKRPFPSETLASYIFQAFASRASSELMRYDTEQRILESESQFKKLIETSKNPIYIIVGNKLALVNSAWLHMFEYTRDEVESPEFSYSQVVAEESQDLFQRRLENFLAGISQPFRYEMKGISKSGKKYDLDVSITYLNWQGKHAVQGVYRNITNAKKKERKLLKSLKESQENELMKTAFLSNLCHEIQTSLTKINERGTEASSMKDNSGKLAAISDFVINESQLLLDHINDIVDISNIELGRLTLKPEKFNLPDLLKDIVQYFLPLSTSKGIDLTCCKKKNGSTFVHADPLRVRQILINLMSNAVKFTEKGEISINYSIRQDDVRISIADTGIGMPSEKIENIHKSFTNPNGKLTGDYDGTGLGLVLTRSLVHLIGGKIWVEQNSGGGSIFYFTIPLA